MATSRQHGTVTYGQKKTIWTTRNSGPRTTTIWTTTGYSIEDNKQQTYKQKQDTAANRQQINRQDNKPTDKPTQLTDNTLISLRS